MPNHSTLAALDIGTTKVCALIAEAISPQEIVVSGVGLEPSLGMRRGVVVDMEATKHAVEMALSKAAQQAGCDVEGVYVGVTGEHICSLNSSASMAITHPNHEITQENVDTLLQAARGIVLPPDRRILHFIPCGFTVDGQEGIRDPVGMSGTRLEVTTHIVHGSIGDLLRER